MSPVTKPVLLLVAALFILATAAALDASAQGNGNGNGKGQGEGGGGGNGNGNGPPQHAKGPAERDRGASGPPEPPAEDPGGTPPTDPGQDPAGPQPPGEAPQDPEPAPGTPSHPARDVPDAPATAKPPPVPPVASFFFEQDGPVVVVDAWDAFDPDGTILTYHWDWGDGTSLSGRDIEFHAYAHPFVAHTIRLTVVDDDGLRATQALTVPAWDGPIVADILAWAEGSTLVVDGGGSDAAPFFITSWAWDWGDGSVRSEGILAEHRYMVPGAYTVTLSITDEAGRTASTTHEVSVEAAHPARGVGGSAIPAAAKVTAAPHVVATSSGELPLIVLVGALGLAARWPGRR